MSFTYYIHSKCTPRTVNFVKKCTTTHTTRSSTEIQRLQEYSLITNLGFLSRALKIFMKHLPQTNWSFMRLVKSISLKSYYYLLQKNYCKNWNFCSCSPYKQTKFRKSKQKTKLLFPVNKKTKCDSRCWARNYYDTLLYFYYSNTKKLVLSSPPPSIAPPLSPKYNTCGGKGTAFLPVLKSNVLLHFKSHYGCT